MTGPRVSLRTLALFVFLASLVWFASYIRYGLAYDEGYLLDSVEKILDGQVIYRDFHHTYAPGSFYLVAGLFKIFGQNILVERCVFVVLEAATCALAFVLVRGVISGGFAYLAPLLVLIAPGPQHKVFFPAFGFLALYSVIVALARGPRSYLGAGMVVGVAAVFRQDVAGFAVAASLAGTVVETCRTRAGLGPFLKRIGCLAAGVAVVVAPVALYFAHAGALGAMIHKIAVEGMLDNMTNRIPFPGLAARTDVDPRYLALVLPVRALFYLPLVAYGLSLAVLGKHILRRTWTRKHTIFAMILVASGLASNQSAFRSDVGHLLQTMQFVLLLAAILLAWGFSFLARALALAGWRRSGVRYAMLALPPAMLFWATAACVDATTDPAMAERFQREGLSVGDTEYLGSMLVRVGNNTRLGLERAPIYVSPGEARFFSEIGRFLAANTSPGEYVLAVPQLQTLYFLFDRKNPTRYAHYRRRLSAEEERRYIEDIKSHGTNYILLTEPFEGARIGETSESFSEYARPVRDWIMQNYDMVDRIGWVKVYRRKP